MPGSGSGWRGEEAEAGELRGNEGLVIVVDHASLSACGGVHGVAESVEQAGLRDGQADTAAALGICCNAGASQTVDGDGTGRGAGSPIVGLEALGLCHRLRHRCSMLSNFSCTSEFLLLYQLDGSVTQHGPTWRTC